jgi:hypothetical protein
MMQRALGVDTLLEQALCEGWCMNLLVVNGIPSQENVLPRLERKEHI